MDRYMCIAPEGRRRTTIRARRRTCGPDNINKNSKKRGNESDGEENR
jgi:hypothetical protein